MFLSRAALAGRVRFLGSSLKTSRGAWPLKIFFKLESTQCCASKVHQRCLSTPDIFESSLALGHASPASLRTTPGSRK